MNFFLNVPYPVIYRTHLLYITPKKRFYCTAEEVEGDAAENDGGTAGQVRKVGKEQAADASDHREEG